MVSMVYLGNYYKSNLGITKKGLREMNTVYELFMQRFISQENKHDFPDGWAIKQVEELTRDELLMELSDAIELRLMKYERKAQEE
jgi:hypothetical protein